MLPLHGSCAAPVQCTFFSAAAPLRQLGVIAGKNSGGSGSSMSDLGSHGGSRPGDKPNVI